MRAKWEEDRPLFPFKEPEPVARGVYALGVVLWLVIFAGGALVGLFLLGP